MFSEEQGEVEAERDDETNVEENYHQNVPSLTDLLIPLPSPASSVKVRLLTGLAASQHNSPTKTNTGVAQHSLETKHI